MVEVEMFDSFSKQMKCRMGITFREWGHFSHTTPTHPKWSVFALPETPLWGFMEKVSRLGKPWILHEAKRALCWILNDEGKDVLESPKMKKYDI